MSASAPVEPPAGTGEHRWWLDPGLAQLAFGSRLRHHAPAADAATIHLAFLPIEALELDLADPAQRDFGDYELLEQIGLGGMGVVYRARQKSLEREVALKLLSAGPWASEEFIAGFKREARNAASLQHPNIVAVYEMGEQDGLIFYAMHLVRGQSLAQCLHARGTLPPREAAALLRTVAEAVDYAHRLGVLHLDMKPGNILLDEDGVAQVTDFGLARRLGQAPSLENEQISGTPSYMAPEQAQVRNARLSPATDIWGVGAVLYEALTGNPPFVGDSPQDILQRVISEDVRRPGRDTPIPRDLEAICLKCLNKAQPERYASARALADDLGRLLEGRSVLARPLNALQRSARWARREPKFAIASGLAVSALIVGLITTGAQWQRAEHNAAQARQQTWSIRADATRRMLEDGRAFDAMPLVLANLREREAQGDAHGAALERLRLGTLQRSGVHLIDVIATGAVGSSVALDRTGTRVAVAVGTGELRLHAVDDGRELWRTDTREASHFWPARALRRISFTPDGRHLIVDRGEPSAVVHPSGHDNILVDAADGRIVLPPPQRFADFRDATYSADGQYAVLRNTAREAQMFRVAGWQALSPRRRFSDGNEMWRVGDGGRYVASTIDMQHVELWDPRTFKTRHRFRISEDRALKTWAAQPDGNLLALGNANGIVRVLDTQALTVRDLEPVPYEAIRSLFFSEDGRWLVASANGEFLWDVDTGFGGPLPEGDSHLKATVDSATGTVFASNSFNAVLWSLPEATGDDVDIRQRIKHARLLAPQFPLGTSLSRYAAAYAPAAGLAASMDVDGELRLWRWRGNHPMHARAAPQSVPDLYFDGRHVVAIEGRRARVITVDGERPVSQAFMHPQPVSLATFTPDGRTLVTVSGRELRAFDWQADRSRFAPIVLANSPLRVLVSPDSRLLLTTTGGYRGGRFHEFASTFDLHTGAPHASGAPLPGPLNGLRFDPDSRHLVSWRYGEVQVRDARTLRAVGNGFRFGPDIAAALRRVFAGVWKPDAASEEQMRGTPVVDAVLSDNATTLHVATTSPYTGDRLLKLDTRTGRTLQTRDLGKLGYLRLLPPRDGYDFVVYDWGGPGWFDRHGALQKLPHASGDLQKALTVSRDGRWLASTSTGGVMLADRDSGEWASATLTAQLPLGDAITQLAFAPDTSSVLARTHHGRLLWWPITPESRPSTQVDRQLAHMKRPSSDNSGLFASRLSHQERTVLRAGDPGTPRAPNNDTRPAPAPSTHASPAPGYAFVDLGPAANRNVGDAQLMFDDDLGYFSSFPVGVQRFLGIDFDIRGVVSLQMSEHSVAVRSPVTRLASLHVLVSGCCMLQGFPHAPYGFLVIGYADGGHARVPILYHQHVWEPWSDPSDAVPAQIAWVWTSPGPFIGLDFPYRTYAARLNNPHPTRDVATLAFEASDLAWSGPLIFAATAQVSSGRVARRNSP